MKLLDLLWKPDRSEGAAYSLYDALVIQSRLPIFYVEYGVDDTLEGRVDMIYLHAIMVLRRLGQAVYRTRRTAQSLYDVLFYDLETGLREQGIGDDGVLHRLRAMTEAFNGRVRAYDEAFKIDDIGPLAAALGRNVFRRDGEGNPHIMRMAHYAMACVNLLEGQTIEALCSGQVVFSDPLTIGTDGASKAQPGQKTPSDGTDTGEGAS